MHRILGLDIAADAVRVVALESGFRGFKVLEARSAALPLEGTPAERLAHALRELGVSQPDGNDSVAVALHGAQVASHLVSLPFGDSRRIEQVLPAEVESAIPFDLSEVVWDHAVLWQEPGRTDVLVAVVRKTVLRELLDGLAAAGVDPKVVTFAPLALAALGERGLLSKDSAAAIPDGATTIPDVAAAAAEIAQPSVALLEAGPDRADFTVLENGRPQLARALSTAPAASWQAAQVTDAALTRLLAPLLRDLKISLRSRARSAQPQKLLLAGPIALLPGAAEMLAAALHLPVHQIELEGVPGAGETALALGLALRAQQPRGRINFRRGDFAFTKDLSQVRGEMGKVAAAALILLVLALALGIAHVGSLSRQARDYDDALCTATKKITGTCYTDYRQAIGALSGGKSKAAGIPRVSAADVFAEVMAHFPEDAMPLLDDVDVTTTSIRVKGTAESFGKVDQIIAGLKKDRCFGEIKQPRVEKLRDNKEGRVSFALDFAYSCSGELAGGA